MISQDRLILDFISLYVRFATESNAQNLDQEIDKIIKPVKNMGLQEMIKEAYIEEGITQGKVEGKKEDVFGMLAERLSLDAIVRITKLPLATIQIWQNEWQNIR